MSKTETAVATAETPAKWSLAQLRAIVAHGMPVADARMLLEEGYTPEDVIELAQLQATQRSAAASESQQATAKAMQKAMRPENEAHPAISSLSYPEGDQARPRPVLPFELWWNGYPMHMFPETEHWRELELATELVPGEYTILRKDGSKSEITITGQYNADKVVTRLDVKFSDTREEKGLTPPKMVALYQMVYGERAGSTPRQAFLAAMQEYFTIFFGSAVGA